MARLFLICVFVTVIPKAQLQNRTRTLPNRPPNIYVQPEKDIYYKVDESVEIQCIAGGVPAPKYNWTRNERPFDTSGNDNRMVILQDSGTIVMNKPRPKDEGIFQCKAYNHLGVSTSININFRQAMLRDFPYGKDEIVTVIPGHPVKLRCTPPTSIPKAILSWHIRDPRTQATTAINLDKRITMDLEGRLYITNVKMEDHQDGKPYVCMAQNLKMRKNTFSHGYIIVPSSNSGTSDNVAPHLLWSTPNELFGVIGQELRIKCIFGGNPTPAVHWENKNGTIPDNRRTLSLGGQQLYISDLQMIDRGSYTCYTTSAIGQRQQRNINVIVKSKPYWLEDGKPTDKERGVGEKATFICRAGGDPTPDIQWYINGVKFKDARHVTIRDGRLIKRDDNNITVIDLRVGDAMVLQCNASNTFGYVFADFYLNVLKERPQFIKRPLKELKVAENTDVHLTCQTSGKPDPIITWFRGSQQITGGRYQIQPNGDLLIQNVVLSDAGNFTCEARNNEGWDSDWGVMIVRRSTRIEQRPKDLEVFAGTDAKFTCSGTTDFEEVSKLRVYWMKDRKEITQSNQRMTTNVQDNSLTISGTISRDSGFYTCVITNELDKQEASAILTVKDRPEPPVDVHKKSCINNTATITWTKGGFNNAPIQYFTIEYNTSVETDRWVFAATANQSDNTITLKLRPGVSYSFRLLATNKIGISNPSRHSEICTTDTSKPYKNPENVRGVGDKPGYLVIEWTPMPPIDHGGRNFRYILKISKRGNVVVDEVTTITNWRQSRYEFLSNDVYTPYNVTIQAANEHQSSSVYLKPNIIYSGESKPGPSMRIDNFVVDNAGLAENAATFYWSWDVNNDAQLHGKFRGFKIQYWVKGMKRVTFREDEVLEKDMTPRYGSVKKRSIVEYTYTLKNLLPFTIMEAQMCLMNTYYVSGPSPIVSFVTKSGVPGPVEKLHPLLIASNFLELTWERPELLNSPIQDADLTNSYLKGYDVGFQTVKGLELGQMQEMDPQIIDPRITKCVLNGLTSNQKYRVYMWARTENGRGESSFIEITTAKSSVMDVPAFSIRNVNSTFFNLTWTMVMSKKYGTVAFAEYRIKGTSDWQLSAQQFSKSWIGVNKLQHGTSYEVRLAVTNGGKTSKGNIEVIKTTGISAAYSLGNNFAWFIGLILSVLILIALSTYIVLMYKKHPEPKRKQYTAPPRRRVQYETTGSDRQGIVHNSSGSLNKGYDNYTYSDREYPDDRRHDDAYEKDYNRGYRDDDERYEDDNKDNYYSEEKGRYDDDGYARRQPQYDEKYDDRNDDRYDDRRDDRYDDRRDDRYDDRHDDRYDDRRDDRYDDRRDDRYDDRYDDQYDRRDSYKDDRRYSDTDKGRNQDYDRHGDRYSDSNRRYSDRSDEGQYVEDESYKPYSRRNDYDRTPSYEKRPSSFAEDVDLREPAKFDADGSPIDDKPSKSPGKSSFV
ncbi:neuroglian-like isoform X2 [Mytilus edulis]|uniref:neuroglian-like isoform X2 n=1 Tax=Mytilus edulis TaxID=6550 RepID=UPI0039F03949